MFTLGILFDSPLHIVADIVVDEIARVVALLDLGHLLVGVDQSLFGALGHHDQTVALTLDTLYDLVEETFGALKFIGQLGDDAKVYLAVGKGGRVGNESCVATHHFDDTDPIVG